MSLSECKVMGLKSHDCHVLMQQLVPVALKGLLLKGPRHAVNRLCLYFKRLCQRVLVREVLLELETDVVDILSLLERYFPPSFFDVMIHLVIHLVREARICGPVQFHWMYPSERMHMNELMVSDRRLIKDSSLLWKIHSEQFPSWLKAKVYIDRDYNYIVGLSRYKIMKTRMTDKVEMNKPPLPTNKHKPNVLGLNTIKKKDLVVPNMYVIVVMILGRNKII
ncbi:uncharacterized protein LOC111023579 isoform X4 [Momordica charantia]|uniref:Uncharacterized protein LOC111023579 isoform X4 n=1 Tax=Momordica charantia TaxID=3673 RepID=A0A6J1DVW7_MOMCH|nr:uncharacterized protein LOC111023579 isoform X4 [Momordica charantia]